MELHQVLRSWYRQLLSDRSKGQEAISPTMSMPASLLPTPLKICITEMDQDPVVLASHVFCLTFASGKSLAKE